MATTETLKALGGEGVAVTITAGPLKGLTGTVVQAEAFPDGHEHQRKIVVELADGQRTYILPRQVNPLVSDVAPPAAHAVAASVAALTAPVVATSAPGVLPANTSLITDPMDPALDAYRPDPSIVKEYVSRTLFASKGIKGYKDTDYLLALREIRDSNGYSPNIALVGDTQSGKTMLVRVLAVLAAERDGMPKPNGSSGISNYDLFGMTQAVNVDGREQLVDLDGIVDLAVRTGSFLYLDEWNAVPPSQAVAIHPVLDERREFTNYQKAVPNGHGGWMPAVTRAAKSFWVISTINPGYKGTQAVAEATSNRFRWIPWNYDEKTEKKLVGSAAVLEFGQELRVMYEQGVVKVPVGTSALVRLAKDSAHLGPTAAISNLIGMYPPKDQIKVMAVFEMNNYADRLDDEFPEPTLMVRTAPKPVAEEPAPAPAEPTDSDIEDALAKLLQDISQT
jgi:hypothetical protein